MLNFHQKSARYAYKKKHVVHFNVKIILVDINDICRRSQSLLQQILGESQARQTSLVIR